MSKSSTRLSASSTMVRARTDSRDMGPPSVGAGAVGGVSALMVRRRRSRRVRVVGGSRRRRRSTTSRATSVTLRPAAKAWARRSDRASSTGTSSWAATIPDAWWTTKRKLPLASSRAAIVPASPPDCMAMMARAATSAITRASACWSATGFRDGCGTGSWRRRGCRRPTSGTRTPPVRRRRRGGRAERGPARRRRVGEVRLGDRGVLAMGVDARPLAERVLELLDAGARSRRTCRPNPAVGRRRAA